MTAMCIVCDSREVGGHYAGLLQCRNCSYVFADLTLHDAELEELYRRNYFFGGEYVDYIADKAVLQKNFRLRLKTLEKFLSPEKHRKLLEVGCAYGFFLDVAKARFDQLTGVDISEDGIRHARDSLGLDVIQGDFLKQDFGARKFDVVCLWDTIEHLKSPHLYVEKAAQLLSSGGVLAITTGDIESVNARIKKEKWRLIHPPTHAHYFSRKTLHRLLDRHGFETVHDEYCGFYRSVDNVSYNILSLRMGKPGLYAMTQKMGIGRMSFYLNLYDIMYVIARKR